jgi:phenylalanyl-tRNA synthetase beta chain
MDARGEVLSLPPVINSEYSKISTETKNIFIEITANDFTKCNIVLNIITALFSEHCADQFTIETVTVNHPKAIPFPPGVEKVLNIIPSGASNSTATTTTTVSYPNLQTEPISVDLDYINRGLGLQFEAPELCKLLQKMQLTATIQSSNSQQLLVTPPPTRSDLLHQIDVQEDVAIAYGYDNLPRTLPQAMTIGSERPLNQLSNHLRQAVAVCGYVEVMTWALISTEENFEKIHRVDPGNLCVTISNSKTDFTACRTTLLPGLLKVVQSNTSYKIPLQIFELGDTVTLNSNDPEGASNHRHLGALYGGHTSGFEEVHAVLTRVMDQLRIPFVPFTKLTTMEGVNNAPIIYSMRPIPDDNKNHSYLPKRCADIVIKKKINGEYHEQKIGQIGTVHPHILKRFGIEDFVVCSVFEIDIEPFV